MFNKQVSTLLVALIFAAPFASAEMKIVVLDPVRAILESDEAKVLADAANAEDVDEAIANVVLDEDLNVSDDEGGAPAGAEEDMQQADGPAQEQQQAQQQQQQQQGQQHGHNLQNGGELQAQPGGDAPMAVADD